MNKVRTYVGKRLDDVHEVLRTSAPTELSHGEHYKLVIGPFATQRGAKFFAKTVNECGLVITQDMAEAAARWESQSARV